MAPTMDEIRDILGDRLIDRKAVFNVDWMNLTLKQTLPWRDKLLKLVFGCWGDWWQCNLRTIAPKLCDEFDRVASAAFVRLHWLILFLNLQVIILAADLDPSYGKRFITSCKGKFLFLKFQQVVEANRVWPRACDLGRYHTARRP